MAQRGTMLSRRPKPPLGGYTRACYYYYYYYHYFYYYHYYYHYYHYYCG